MLTRSTCDRRPSPTEGTLIRARAAQARFCFKNFRLIPILFGGKLASVSGAAYLVCRFANSARKESDKHRGRFRGQEIPPLKKARLPEKKTKKTSNLRSPRPSKRTPLAVSSRLSPTSVAAWYKTPPWGVTSGPWHAAG